MRARHALYYKLNAGDSDDIDDTLDERADLVLGIKCMAHGLHNGIGWGLAPHLELDITTKDAHVSIAALLNCSTAIQNPLDRRPDGIIGACAPRDLSLFDCGAFKGVGCNVFLTFRVRGAAAM